jgi:hypothetical protein
MHCNRFIFILHYFLPHPCLLHTFLSFPPYSSEWSFIYIYIYTHSYIPFMRPRSSHKAVTCTSGAELILCEKGIYTQIRGHSPSVLLYSTSINISVQIKSTTIHQRKVVFASSIGNSLRFKNFKTGDRGRPIYWAQLWRFHSKTWAKSRFLKAVLQIEDRIMDHDENCYITGAYLKRPF